MLTIHERIQKILSGGGGGGGVGCPENFILVFFTEGSADLASLSKQLDPRVLLLLDVVNNSISKETYNNL